ncbi:MAG TPA: ThuA domain-containing protein, partial [Polyangia bacterium]
VHFPDDFAPRILPLLGGYYSDAISVNPIWSASFAANTTHPIRRGVPAFDSRDEWYFNIRFAPETDRITPILQALPPDDLRFTPDAAQHAGRRETVAWTFNRSDGGRSFGFTGGHFHDNWGNEPFRRTIVNAVLWTAGIDIPTAGAAANIDPAWLRQNLDPKGQ